MAQQPEATEVHTCSECGRPVPADAQTLGLCPRCLMRSAVHAGAEAVDEPGAPRDFVAPPPEEIAGEFPGLEVLELIGRGGMGAVYKARQVGLDRVVAVKIFPLEAAEAEAPPADASGGSAAGNFPQRFRHESRLLARLSHPNIVAAHQAGQTARYCYLVMEYVPGPTLREVLHRGPLPPAEAVRVAVQVCDALDSAHGQGVIHRDVKPENILLQEGATGRVRVADFGLAKLLDHRPPWMGMTAEGHRLGTPYYIAPEQNRPGETVDARADVYAVGVLLYETLTGELPIGRFAAPSEKVRQSGRGGGWPLDERLDRIVLRCLEPDPRLRYQRVADLKQDLIAVTAQPARRPQPPPPHAPSPAQHAPLAYQPTVPESIHPAYRRRLVLNAAAVGAVATVVLLLAGAAVAIVAWRARARAGANAPPVAAAPPPATAPAAPATAPAPFPRLTRQPWPPGFGPRIGPPTFTGPEEWLQQMTEEHGRDRIVTLHVDGLPGDVTSHIRERLQALARPARMYSSGSADSLTVRMAPVSDVAALAGKIDFGTVQSVDPAGKVIRVRADPGKLPKPLAPAVTDPRDRQFYPRNLADLNAWDAGRRRDAVTRLRDAPPAAGALRASIAEALRRRLKEDSDSHTRAAAATALTTWVQPENAQALADALKDPDWLVRRQVLEALGKLKDPETAPAVAAMLPTNRHEAAVALKAYGAAAEDAVLPYLTHADHWVRMEAANVLGVIGTPESLPALKALSETRDGLAPGAAKQAIEAIRKRHAA